MQFTRDNYYYELVITRRCVAMTCLYIKTNSALADQVKYLELLGFLKFFFTIQWSSGGAAVETR
jgi:hypothetical protein